MEQSWWHQDTITNCSLYKGGSVEYVISLWKQMSSVITPHCITSFSHSWVWQRMFIGKGVSSGKWYSTIISSRILVAGFEIVLCNRSHVWSCHFCWFCSSSSNIKFVWRVDRQDWRVGRLSWQSLCIIDVIILSTRCILYNLWFLVPFNPVFRHCLSLDTTMRYGKFMTSL